MFFDFQFLFSSIFLIFRLSTSRTKCPDDNECEQFGPTMDQRVALFYISKDATPSPSSSVKYIEELTKHCPFLCSPWPYLYGEELLTADVGKDYMNKENIELDQEQYATMKPVGHSRNVSTVDTLQQTNSSNTQPSSNTQKSSDTEGPSSDSRERRDIASGRVEVVATPMSRKSEARIHNSILPTHMQQQNHQRWTSGYTPPLVPSVSSQSVLQASAESPYDTRNNSDDSQPFNPFADGMFSHGTSSFSQERSSSDASSGTPAGHRRRGPHHGLSPPKADLNLPLSKKVILISLL